MPDDYMPLHEEIQSTDEPTVEDLDVSNLTPANVARRLERAQAAADRYVRDLRLVLRYLDGDASETEVWAGVRGLPSKGMGGSEVDVVEQALRVLRNRAEDVRRLTADAFMLRRIERTLNATDSPETN